METSFVNRGEIAEGALLVNKLGNAGRLSATLKVMKIAVKVKARCSTSA